MKKGVFLLLMLVLTLTACGSAKTEYTIKFDTGDRVAVESMKVHLDDTVNLPEPVLEGYSFSGWYYDRNLTNQFTAKSVVDEDLTLYSEFEKNNYKINIYNQDGDKVFTVTEDYGYDLDQLILFTGEPIYYDLELMNLLSTSHGLDGDIDLYVAGNSKDHSLKIGVILPDASEYRWANLDGSYFFEELSALGAGYEFEILFSEGDEQTEMNNIEYLIDEGVQVIILTTSASGGPALGLAHEAGIPVITHDRFVYAGEETPEYHVTFNSWEVGKAMGKHLVDEAKAEGCTVSSKCDLALFSGRIADWPNATYFFGGAMEEIQPELAIFNIVNYNPEPFETLGFYTEATFDQDAKNDLQNAMNQIDTDWNPVDAGIIAESLIAQLQPTSDSIFILAPADFIATQIRIEFAKMQTPYLNMYITGQDAMDVAIASLMGDPIKGEGTQTMTVFKDVHKMVLNSVQVAKNLIDGVDGLTGIDSSAVTEGTTMIYTEIDVLLASTPQHTYDLIFAPGYKDKNNNIFSNIDFSQYE